MSDIFTATTDLSLITFITPHVIHIRINQYNTELPIYIHSIRFILMALTFSTIALPSYSNALYGIYRMARNLDFTTKI